MRKLNQDFFQNPNLGRYHARAEAISVVVSGDLAAAHYIVPITWTDNHGTHFQRSRCTDVLKKIDGKWLIWHEHFSVPYDPTTGKAVLDASPSKD
jgi:ketosteroid isomerase-like protein